MLISTYDLGDVNVIDTSYPEQNHKIDNGVFHSKEYHNANFPFSKLLLSA